METNLMGPQTFTLLIIVLNNFLSSLFFGVEGRGLATKISYKMLKDEMIQNGKYEGQEWNFNKSLRMGIDQWKMEDINGTSEKGKKERF